VAVALKNPEKDPTYLEFFELARPPFARLSQPSQIFDTDQYSMLTDHLIGATKTPDCLISIFGANGSGKTTLLNRYITGLDEDVYFAAIDENCRDEMQFYCTFLRQLGFGEITGTLEELKRITKEFLINRGIADDPVLIFIDNAHLIKPVVFDQLRWISCTKIKSHRVVSVVLAGNSDLGRIMNSPEMKDVKFKSQVDFNIRVYTEEETTNYVSHRLKLAGENGAVNFSKEAQLLIYEFTGGTPSLINTLCDAALTEAHALESQDITEDLIRVVADSRKLKPHVIDLPEQGRRKIDPDYVDLTQEQPVQMTAPDQDTSTKESIELPPRATVSEFDVENLLKRVSSLSEQLGELRADRKRSFEDISSRDKVIAELQEQLKSQTSEIKTLTGAVDNTASEIDRLNLALSDTTIALQKSEKASAKLTNDLQKNQLAANIVKTDIKEAKTEVKELGRENTGLQRTIFDLKAELKQAVTQASKKNSSKKKSAKGGNGKKDTNIAAFEVVRDGTVEQRMPVTEGQSRFMIGRSEDSELCLNSEFVSRHHALIFCNGQGTHVEDLNSFNGTGVNADPITRSELFAGDTINIGDFEIRLKSA